MKKLLFLAIVVLGISAVSFGQSNVLTNATANAKIIEKLTISQTTGLNFGTIASNNGQTDLTVDESTGDRSGSADYLATPAATRGKFHVTGLADSNYSISFSPSVLISSPTVTTAAPMTVSEFKASDGASGHKLNSGISDFYVGAKLTINANQAPADDYTGQYIVTVLYE